MRKPGGAREGVGWARPAAVISLTLILCLLAACGRDSDGSDNSKVTLTIGSDFTTEQIILGNIYAQALQAAGYQVETDFALGGTDYPREVLVRGQIAGYPENTNTALEMLFGVAPADIPSDPEEAYEMAKAEFEKEGLTAFPPTPFSLANAVGTLKKTADERGLETTSDLAGQAEEMTLKGPVACKGRPDCLGGLETEYGITFKSFSPIPESEDSDVSYEALENGETDAAMVLTTDGELSSDEGRFVILEDDEHVFPAGNVIFVTSPTVVEEAGPDFEETIVAAQEGLTAPVMQELNAKYEAGQDLEKIAIEYLKSIDLSG
jgi:osmoprotectant transport system substrate-binding protein